MGHVVAVNVINSVISGFSWVNFFDWLLYLSNYRCLITANCPTVHFTVVCLVAKPLNRNEAKGDLVMIQTLLLFKCRLLCYHAN